MTDLTSVETSGTIEPKYDDETGYIYLTDGTHRQVICKRVGNELVLHWKFDGTAVAITRDEWLKLFQ